ncbi:hypothetical protein AB0D27_06305 [Streptomyces sp. NPDC048415]|jgi:hypothetical protein|uniref:hypothetical protein n=1 Tax=Streptomyces sp. NPDC048415 TaxID=3154822 RepID=UPI00342D08A2
MSLVELIAQADERGLAASGLACLDRCVPLLGGDDEILRPLWASLAEPDVWGSGGSWGDRIEQIRAKLDADAPEPALTDEDEAAVLTRRMLDAVPAEPSAAGLRTWADACSVAALQIHRLLDVADDGASCVTARREGRTDGMSPLVAAELRRQVTILELLADRGAGGLRLALVASTEGRRVLRAVVSRRARGRA